MYICICEGVTEKQIQTAIAEGASSVRDLRKELGVAGQCGQCGKCAKKLLKEHGCGNAYQKLSQQVSSSTLVNAFTPIHEVTA